MFYYDKANDGSPQAVKIDQSFHRSENPRPHHRTGGGGPDLNQTSHYQPSQIYNQSGNYVPIQVDPALRTYRLNAEIFNCQA